MGKRHYSKLARAGGYASLFVFVGVLALFSQDLTLGLLFAAPVGVLLGALGRRGTGSSRRLATLGLWANALLLVATPIAWIAGGLVFGPPP